MDRSTLLVAAPASGHGKTVVTRLLANQMQQDKHPIALIKLGPDYIDPTYHRICPLVPCFNIDTWAMSHEGVLDLIHAIEPKRSIIIESATGLFDGALSGNASAAQFCIKYRVPILLVIDCSAMGATIAAIVHGITTFDNRLHFAGIVLNKVASKNHARILTEALALLEIPITAILFRSPALHLERRHLGLTQAEENPAITGELQSDSDITKIFAASNFDPPPASISPPPIPPLGNHIAIANDVAFSFTYAHFLHYWKLMGVHFSFFSPLLDEAPPLDADAIFLPGGYPELHLETLAHAHKFKNAMQTAANNNVNIYGECGGFMVLGNGIIDTNNCLHPMLDLLPHVTSFYQPKLCIGYRNLTLLQDCALGKSNTSFKGHCFHYTQMVNTPSLPPLFKTTNALLENTGSHGYRLGSVCGSYYHIIVNSPNATPLN